MINNLKANFFPKTVSNQPVTQVVTNPVTIEAVNRPSVQKRTPVKQNLPIDLYFISMKHYGRDLKWAERMLNATENISELIQNKENFSDVLLNIEDYVHEFNPQAGSYGFRRDPWDNQGAFVIKRFTRGEEYYDRYHDRYQDLDNDVIKIKSNNSYPNANTCNIFKLDEDRIFIEYGTSKEYSNIEFAKEEYNKLLSKENPTIDEINKSVATIHWLMAQESPYLKGSDSVANLLTKSIYHAYNVKLSPLKEGRSLDFEAFYTNLDDFIEMYPYFFQIKPYIINSFSANA